MKRLEKLQNKGRKTGPPGGMAPIRRRDFKMAKKDKEYKIKRGQLDGAPGRFSHARLTVCSLLCVAAAFVLAYFWQYGTPGAIVPADVPAAGQQEQQASSQPPQSPAAPSGQPSSRQGGDTLAVPPASRPIAESAPESAAPVQQSQADERVLVVGGEASQVSSAQEVGGEKKDFSVAYQVKASEAVDDGYFSDALFVGDSITTGIELYGAMSGAAVVASTGINPSTILSKPAIRDEAGNLHTVLETMSGYQPEKIYVLLGANGVGWISQDTFIDYYAQLLEQIEKQHPGALIYVQSIFPVTTEKALSENGIYANERIDSYNEAIMELCKKKGLPYLNVAEALRGPDGALPADASTDGIHIIPEYYRRWFDYLKTHTVPSKQQEREKG